MQPRTVWVRIDDRDFIVTLVDKTPMLIKERKKYRRYSIDSHYNVSYWHKKHHKTGSSKTIVSRIIAAALKQ